MKKSIKSLFVLGSFLLGTALFAQDKIITGKVIDKEGLPISEAIVTSSNGHEVITDINGQFSIESSVGDHLTIEVIGLPIEIVIIGKSDDYLISLKPSDVVELEGVVLTALGISREKSSLGYATQEVKGEVVQAARGSNVVQALSGNVSGAQITAPTTMGGSTRIILRGISSITGENKPLIIVDGIPFANYNINNINTERGSSGYDYGDGIFDINPDDVESISVLKGGPSSALYGARAINGVILIKTKKGSKGREEIVFNTGVAFEQINQMQKLQYEYGGGRSNFFEKQIINGIEYSLVDYKTDESWGPKFNGQQVLHWYSFDPEFPNDYLQPREWKAPDYGIKYFFNTGTTYTNSVSFSKGYDNSTMRFSLSNVDTKGIVPNSSLKRNVLGLAMSHKFNEKFDVNTSMNYSRIVGNRTEGGYGINSVVLGAFQYGQMQLDYKKLKEYKVSDYQQRTWNRKSWSDRSPAFSDNPYWLVYENTNTDQRDRFYGNVEFKYDIIPGLYAFAKIAGDTYDMILRERTAHSSSAISSYAESIRKFTEMNYESRIHYSKRMGDYTLSSFAGINRRHITSSRISSTTLGGLVVPGLYSITNSYDRPGTSGARSTKEVNSIFGFLSLGYKKTLFLEGTLRNDWFSTLPKNNNNYLYPSGTVSFVFSEIIKQKWLNFGKLRAGISQISSDLDVYQTKDVFNPQSNFLDSPSFGPSNIKASSDLKPEIKKTWEVGLEFSMFKNRLGFDVTYYDEKIDGVLLPIQYSNATGSPYKWMNAAVLVNRGVEATVTIVPLQFEEFQWKVTGNFGKNINKVKELSEDLDSYFIVNSPFKVQIWALLGERFGQILGTDYVYTDNGEKIIGANGLYQWSKLTSLGSIIPDYNLGIRNTFSFKRIEFSALIDIQKGGQFYSTSHMWGMYSGMLAETAANGIRETGLVKEGVVWDNTSNSYVQNTKTVTAFDHFRSYFFGPDKQNIFNADYVKLREVTLSYTFPEKFKGPFANVVVSAFGRNMATWGLYKKGFDPEQSTYSSGNIHGVEGGSLPSTRTFGMNLKVQF